MTIKEIRVKITETIVSVFDKSYQARKDETIAKIIKLLSDEEFSKYREEGRNLTLEEVCQLVING